MPGKKSLSSGDRSFGSVSSPVPSKTPSPVRRKQPPSEKIQGKTGVYVSVVIPVFNEEQSLENLYARVVPVLQGLQRSWELILVNDGSQDRSSEILKTFHKRLPHNIRIVELSKNFGQHMAILAGFENVRGQVIVNLDADLQNPPEEIPHLLKRFEEGYDLVSGYRQNRHDHVVRRFISKLSNIVREYMTGLKMRDHGCMLKVYSRPLVDNIVACKEHSTFLTVLACQFALNPIDVPVKHEAREQGISKYTPLKLIQYSLDMFTSSSTVPLRLFTLFGFFLISVAISGIGIVGEYVGRIYQVVRGRPRFSVKCVRENLDFPQEKKKKSTKI